MPDYLEDERAIEAAGDSTNAPRATLAGPIPRTASVVTLNELEQFERQRLARKPSFPPAGDWTLRGIAPSREGQSGISGPGSSPLRWHRYEAKYVITEAQAADIRRYCEACLAPDRHTQNRPGRGYSCLSVYLDSPSRELLRQAVEHRVRRYKLRIRTYRSHDERPSGAPVFLEIKSKLDGVVYKVRARVPPARANALLYKGAADDGEMDRFIRASGGRGASEFVDRSRRIGASPVVGVCYTREAYESESADRVRITMDRDLHYGLLPNSPNRRGELWAPVNTGAVILEVKFTNTYPFWVAQMLRRVEVTRRGVCKYVICARAALATDRCREA